MVHKRFEKTVLEKHLGGFGQGIAGKIVDYHLWKEQYSATVLDNPPIEFVILVTYQFFIEETDFVENFPFETAERYCIDPHFMVRSDSEVRVSHSERGAHGVRDGSANGGVFCGQSATHSADIVCSGLL